MEGYNFVVKVDKYGLPIKFEVRHFGTNLGMLGCLENEYFYFDVDEYPENVVLKDGVIHKLSNEEHDVFLQNVEALKEKDTQRQDILNELIKCDIEMNPARVIEDLINGIEVNQRVLEIIIKKQELREKLGQL